MDYKNVTIRIIQEKYRILLLGIFTFFMFGILTRTLFIRHPISITPKKETKKRIEVKKYAVKVNDDLWSIAEKTYGSGYNALDIASANHLKEPYILKEGQILILPVVTPKKATKGEITDKAFASTKIKSLATSYVVKEGDYIFKIAEEMYGDGNAMMRIIEANKITYPFDIQAGMRLIIPR